MLIKGSCILMYIPLQFCVQSDMRAAAFLCTFPFGLQLLGRLHIGCAFPAFVIIFVAVPPVVIMFGTGAGDVKGGLLRLMHVYLNAM